MQLPFLNHINIIVLVETNYQSAYYVSDGFLAAFCLIVVIFLDVNAEKNKQNLFRAFKSVVNPAMCVFLLIMFLAGIGQGVYFSYVIVYIQEDLQGSSAMVGK